MKVVQRNVASIDHPSIEIGHDSEHRVRRLINPGHWAMTDPFLLLMEDWFHADTFGEHPHRGFETVTYVIEGEIEHYDNKGNGGIIRSGDVQWMTAGRGVVHNETPPKNSITHSLQLWVNLPSEKKMVEPRYQYLESNKVPRRREKGADILVFSGSSGGVISPTKNYAYVTMVEFRLDAEANVTQDLPGDYHSFFVILNGEGKIGMDKSHVRNGDVVWLTNGSDRSLSKVEIATESTSLRALLFAGHPLQEPVVARGPFVMNTEEQIKQAYYDFSSGHF